ncbi:hypothetical protein LCGC14_0447830 [marine sediment metagenome]|uniref:Uncharacterized protein n=1 Tax=marine sediment metagenome TaxID=412755 RepID=A0A0F9VSR0_9ZZZZ
MAAEPSNAKTMSDLMLRVAEKLGIAEYDSVGRLHIPVDQYNFNLCKRYITNGIVMFMADSPPKGWRWMRRLMSVTFATRVAGTVDSASTTTMVDATLSSTYDTDEDLTDWYVYILTGTGAGSYAQITSYTASTGSCGVDAWLDSDGNLTGTTPAADDTFAITSVATDAGDNAKYILPANFSGSADGIIQYAAGSNRSTPIDWCDEAEIRTRRTPSIIGGPPRKAAIVPYQPVDETLSQTRLWVLLVDPRPISTDTVQFPYTLYFDSMKMESGVATAGSAISLSDSARANVEADSYFNGWIITIIDGTGVGETATVTGYTSSSGKFDFSALSGGSTPTTTSQYIVQPPNNLHPAGHQFDDTVESACLARTEMESQDIHFDTFWSEYYHKKAIPNAFKTDMRSAPRKLGPMLSNEEIRNRRYRGRSYNDVTYT